MGRGAYDTTEPTTLKSIAAVDAMQIPVANTDTVEVVALLRTLDRTLINNRLKSPGPRVRSTMPSNSKTNGQKDCVYVISHYDVHGSC